MEVPSPTSLLQDLIRFDTTNPPGNEAACMGYMRDLLAKAGFEPAMVGKVAGRPNLVTRMEGRGEAPPLLLYGHVDVVTTADQRWSVPPFSGEIRDGWIWGRGALDMKGGIAMMAVALLRAKAEAFVPAGDVIFAVLCDEEVGGALGAQYLVENHRDLFAGVRFAIGEFGGFPLYVGGKKFAAIQVAEKQVCWLRGKVRGQGGHGSVPMRGGAMAKLARVLDALDRHRLPVHITPVMRQMLEAIVAATPAPTNGLLSRLLVADTVDQTLDALGGAGMIFDANLHNTVNATVVQGGSKTNVIPSEISFQLDGRLLPGCSSRDLLAEVADLVGSDVELEILQHTPGPTEVDMGLYPLFADVMREIDPEGIPVPLLLNGSTDARHFARIGIQTYGFLPMDLPPDFDFVRYIHAADERVPVASLEFGTGAISRVLRKYGTAR